MPGSYSHSPWTNHFPSPLRIILLSILCKAQPDLVSFFSCSGRLQSSPTTLLSHRQAPPQPRARCRGTDLWIESEFSRRKHSHSLHWKGKGEPPWLIAGLKNLGFFSLLNQWPLCLKKSMKLPLSLPKVLKNDFCIRSFKTEQGQKLESEVTRRHLGNLFAFVKVKSSLKGTAATFYNSWLHWRQVLV